MNKSTRLTLLTLNVLFCCLTNASLVAAQEKKEIQDTPAPLELPAVARRYIDFYSSSQINFSIDPDSIALQPGAENEVRYTLKATSKQGAVNISYEGIRCDRHQKIMYATGQTDGSWSKVRSPEWMPIYVTGINIQHARLANGYFCSVESIAGKLRTIVKRFEAKDPLDVRGL